MICSISDLQGLEPASLGFVAAPDTVITLGNAAMDRSLVQLTLPGLNDNGDESVHRVLAALDTEGRYDSLLPWLRSLLKHKDNRIKSKAVKLLCKAWPNSELIEEQLKSTDGRIRANAIEALWFHQSPASRAIFYNALSDPNHRVVVNALIGLYYQDDKTAMPGLLSLSKHSSELFRAAAIWAFNHLYDYRAVTALQALLDDGCKHIREKARNALTTLLYVGE